MDLQLGWVLQRCPVFKRTHFCSQTFNSRNQSPCEVATIVGGLCVDTGCKLYMHTMRSSNLWAIDATNPLPPNATAWHYGGPSVAEATSCVCSSVYYSMLSACGLCQGAGQVSRYVLFNFTVPVTTYSIKRNKLALHRYYCPTSMISHEPGPMQDGSDGQTRY